MPTTSPIQGVPVPQGSDADNVPYDLAQAINFLEKRLVMVFADAAARDATIASPTEGMVAYLQATDEFTGRIGSAWIHLISRLDLAGTGSATTVAKSDHTHDTSAYSVNYAASAGNADTVDGYHASAFAGAGHGHDVSGASVNYANSANYANSSGQAGSLSSSGGGYSTSLSWNGLNMTKVAGAAGSYARIDASGNFYNGGTSLRALKKEIADAEIDPDAVLALRPVTYRFDPDAEGVDDVLAGLPTQYGLVAEEVEEAGVEVLVGRDADGALAGVHYDLIGLALLPVVQRQAEQIEALEARLEAAGL